MESNRNPSNIKLNKLENPSGYHFNLDKGKRDFNDLTLSLNLPKAPPTITALDQLEDELLNSSILTYNSELDKVLRDEITPKRITEIAGFPGSGKTQICFQLCIVTQLPKLLGGLEGEVIYINTNKNFSSHRIRELSQKFLKQVRKVQSCSEFKDFSEETILKHIYVISVRSIAQLSAIVKYIKSFLIDKKVSLVIIDSISSPLRDLESKERSVVTYKLLEDLQSLAVIFNFAIVVTNDFTTKIKEGKPYYAPSLGDGFFDRVNSRICLSKSTDNNVYIAELVKSTIKRPLKARFCMF